MENVFDALKEQFPDMHRECRIALALCAMLSPEATDPLEKALETAVMLEGMCPECAALVTARLTESTA